MSKRVTLIQGGGIGFDQTKAVRRVLEKAGADVEWEEHFAGSAAVEQHLPPLDEDLFESVRRNKLALKTKLLVPAESHDINYNVEFRQGLGLFASVRPLKNLRGLPARFQDVDILVIRELTEDLYAAIEHEIVPGVVQSIKVVTEAACRRFFGFAFDYAQKHRRKKIHCVHKANILKMADGLFLDAFRSVAKDYPEIETREIIVDNCCMQLVSRPHQFDVMVMGNLYGDIVSDLGAGLVGGISATSGINFGDDVQVFDAIHGGTIAEIGRNCANPLPLLLPAMNMLEAIGQNQVADRVLQAVQVVLSEGKLRTADLGGTATTEEFTDAVVAAI